MASIVSAGTTSATALNMSADTSGILQLASNNGTVALTVDTSQNVGIGTTSPGNKLEVTGDVKINAASNGTRNLYFGPASGNYAKLTYDDSAGTLNVNTIYAYPLLFSTNNTERMRIDSGGNLLIGTTGGSYKLNVYNSSTALLANFTTAGGAGTSATVQIQASNTAGCDANLYMECPGQFGGGLYLSRANAQLRAWIGSGTNGVSLANNGNSWGSYSDERLKDIIEPINEATKKVSTLRAVIGKYKTDEEGKRRSFLIAQDVQKVLPEAVYANSEEDDTLNLSYTDVIPLLVAAIQELNAKVTALENK